VKAEWDTPQWRVKRDELLATWLLGDFHAVECAVLLSEIAETWDDLIDQDVTVTADKINRAFIAMLVRLELNPFFEQHRLTIMPVVYVSINAWLDANTQESGVREERMAAFYLRNFSYEIINVIALCVGGWDHLRSISMDMRRFFTHESYFTWEHRHASDLPAAA